MEAGNFLHLLNFFLMLATASVPAYLALRLRGSNKRLSYMSASLAAFAFIHGLYHLSDFFELQIADQFLLPFSVVLLVVFGFVYLKVGA